MAPPLLLAKVPARRLRALRDPHLRDVRPSTAGHRPATAGFDGRSSPSSLAKGALEMLWIISLLLTGIWAVGFTVFHLTSGPIHVLLVAGLVVAVVRLLQGLRVV
jgi:hypothetical protein